MYTLGITMSCIVLDILFWTTGGLLDGSKNDKVGYLVRKSSIVV